MDLRDPGTGITRDSLAFYRDHRHELSTLDSVELRFPGFDDPHNPYLMTLTDTAGNQMLLSGCTTGYVGEGPNASLQLLVAEAVPVELALAVTDASRLIYRCDADGWRIDAYEGAHRPDDTTRDTSAQHEHIPTVGRGR